MTSLLAEAFAWRRACSTGGHVRTTRAGLTHDGVPRYYFVKMLQSSLLPDKP